MNKNKHCVVGVFYRDVSHVLDYAFALVGHERGSSLNAVALLLSASELAVLMTKEDWCLIEDEDVTIETLRIKARSTALGVFGQFKDSEPS